MAKSKHIFLWVILSVAVAGLAASVISDNWDIIKGWFDNGSNETYVPIPEFEPVLQVLDESAANAPDAETADSPGNMYSLDATMRVIRGLEVAGSQSANFSELMDCIVQQDYSMAASDAIEIQKELLPIIQKMYLLSKENEKMTDLWVIQQSVSSSLSSTCDGLLNSSNIASAALKVTPQALLGSVQDIAKDYIDTHKLKSKNKREIERLSEQYSEALKEYWPVYSKYKFLWEALCVKKDQAYLDLYSGDLLKSYNEACKILEEYPNDRDALLIKAISLANMDPSNSGFIIEAEATADSYMNLYPERTAPAWLIKGILARNRGETAEAITDFDHAAIEYPRQAKQLTDILDAYTNRAYFSATGEGVLFQQMYRSTIEGYGYFSPNFQKALIYRNEGNSNLVSKEIYNHFFRRGNQSAQSFLLADMDYCTKNLSGSFEQAFPKNKDISFGVSEKTSLLTDLNLKDKKLEFTLVNNCQEPLKNVRLFICYHLVGMHPDDYVVKPLNPVNIIDGHTSNKWTVSDFPTSDVVSTRAVLLTDDTVAYLSPDGQKKDVEEKSTERPNWIERNLKILDAPKD